MGDSKCAIRRCSKAQSAMEYLMTYGWTILIIAVVLGVLFQLGVFSSANFMPKAQPGSCKIFRATGITSLQGVCTGQVPQYAAQFDGQSSYISIPNSQSMSLSTSFSISFWLNKGGYQSTCKSVIGKPGSTQLLLYIMTSVGCGPGTTNGRVLVFKYVDSGGTSHDGISSSAFNGKVWTYAVATFNNGVMTWYLNGNPAGQTTGLPNPGTNANTLKIGYGDSYFNGTIANVQFYNTSLDANQISALYLEGIGGAPIDPYHIVGWWPLNGDTNDYSGNNNGGAPTNVIYTSSWMSGYTPP